MQLYCKHTPLLSALFALQANAKLASLQQQMGSSQQDATLVKQQLAASQVCVV